MRRISALQRSCYTIEVLDWSPRFRRRRFVDALRQLDAGTDPFRANRVVDRAGKLTFNRNMKDAARANLRGPFDEEERRGAIVRWIETLHWGEKVPRSIREDTGIEHVLPRTAKGEWENAFSEPEREHWTNRLGNLCILPRRVNEDVGHAFWPQKEKAYQSLDGQFKGVGLVLGASAVASPRDAPTEWKAAAVASLTNYLADLADQALGLVSPPRR